MLPGLQPTHIQVDADDGWMAGRWWWWWWSKGYFSSAIFRWCTMCDFVVEMWRCFDVTVRRDSRKVQMFGTLFVERKYPV